MASLHAKLKRLRKKLVDLNQEPFAKAIGSSQSRVSRYETGRAVPPVGYLLKIVRAFPAEAQQVGLTREGLAERALREAA